MEKRNCLECGKPFLVKDGNIKRKYCSKICRDRRTRKSLKKIFPHIGTKHSRHCALKDISEYTRECDSFFNRNYLPLEKDILNLDIINLEIISISK